MNESMKLIFEESVGMYDMDLYDDFEENYMEYEEPIKKDNLYVDNPYVYHNDKSYKATLTTLNIAKNQHNFLKTNEYLFAYMKQSKLYEWIKLEDIGCLIDRNYLYEIVNSETAIRLYMDLDIKENELSFLQILKLIEDFKIFLKMYYDYDVNFNTSIHLSLKPSQLQNTYSIEDKFISSCHIIFDIIVDDVIQAKQIIKSFINTRAILTEYIDIKVYSYRRKFRTLYQAKEQVLKTDIVSGKKFYKFVVNINNNLIHDKSITKEDFISCIIPSNTEQDKLVEITNKKHILVEDYSKFINVKIEEPIIKLSYVKYQNVFYCIDQIKKLKRYLNELKEVEWITNYYWNNNLKLVVATLIIANVKWIDIINHEIIKLFLKLSRVKDYDTDEWNLKNIIYIKNVVEKQILHNHFNKDFFEPLTEKSIYYIYNLLNLNPTDTILITEQLVNKKSYLLINYGNNLIELLNNQSKKSETKSKTTSKIINSLKKNKPIKNELINEVDPHTPDSKRNCLNIKKALFIPTKQILLIDFQIDIEKNEATGENKEVIYSNIQKQLAIEEIKQIGNITETSCYNIIEVLNLHDVEINAYENRYLTAPVGAGKSYIVLRKDIHSILKTKENKIIVITDTISMANKSYADILNIIKENGFTEQNIKLYNSSKDKFTADTKILICCYDSIYKYKEDFTPTHLIIDEFVNVCKRITGTQKIGNEKELIRNYYFKLIQSCYLKFYDADIDELMLQIIKHNYNINFKIVSLINYVQLNTNVVLTTEDKMKSNILKCLNFKKNITISSTSTILKMKEFMDEISEIYKDIKMVLIYKDGAVVSGIKNDTASKKLKNELCSNTEMWKNYNVVIYSPSITTGISFNDREYFYKHFHFCSPKSADSTQNSQMIHRVRKNETNTIEICVSNNSISTLKNIDILNTTKERIYNFELFNLNRINETNVALKQIQLVETNNQINCVNKNFKLNTTYSIHNSILDIEEFNNYSKTYRLLYDLFKKIFKYGSHFIDIKFFSKIKNKINQPIQPTFVDIVMTDEDREKALLFRYKMKYENAVYLLPELIKDEVNDEEEYDFNRHKTNYLSKVNYSYSIWNYNNDLKLVYKLLVSFKTSNDIELIDEIKNIIIKYENYDYEIINKLLEFTDEYADMDINILIKELYYGDEEYFIEDINDIRNRIDYVYDKFEEHLLPEKEECIIYNHQDKFIKSNNISYYEIKELIYKIFDNSFKSEIEINNLKTKLRNSRDLQKFIEFIYGLYVSFKIFDLIGITNNQIQELYLNKSKNYGLKINKNQFKNEIENIMNKTKNHFEILISLTDKKLFKKDSQYKQQLTTAFNVLNLDIEVGRVNDKFIYVMVKNNSFHYRIQKLRLTIDTNNDVNTNDIEYDNEEDNEAEDFTIEPTNTKSLNMNELDDLYYQIRNNNSIKPTTITFKINSLPKITLYNSYLNLDFSTTERNKMYKNKSPSMRTSNANYLYYVIQLFCNEPSINELVDELIKTNNLIKDKIQSVKNIKIHEFNYDFTNELICINQDITTTKEVNKEEKSISTAKAKEDRDTKIICEICGGTYLQYKIKQHILTKKHQTKCI
jgi:hypothetical protein